MRMMKIFKSVIYLFPLFLAALTLDEKIGQLFMAPACPLRGEDHWTDWQHLLTDYHIGNAIVKQSDPLSQVTFLRRLQAASPQPLLIAADAEWGLAMRMSDTLAFPRNQALGALDLNLLFQLGQTIGQQAHLVGIHLNLAPVADINNNPANPIIGARSFGDDPHRVAACASAVSRGLQSAGLLSCAKHFPGHGDTHVDSHRALPLIPHSRARLEALEFIPFKQLVAEGIPALMTAHLLVPALDPLYPASLSRACLTGILRDEWHFEGLIISDALNMEALSAYTPEEIAILARRAGCDLLLYGDHIAPNIDAILRDTIPRAFQALKEAYLSGILDLDELDASVARILKAKEGIRPIPVVDSLREALHSPEAMDLQKRLLEEAAVTSGSAR